jgi:hypothetical protein
VTASTKAVGGWVDGMARASESPFPPLRKNKPKVLCCEAEGLDQKVGDPGAGMNSYPAADVASPADRRGLTHHGAGVERGKPVALPR